MTERLKKMVDGVIIEMTEQEEAEFRASLPAPVPAPTLTKLYKATLWRRVSDEEAELLHGALAQAPFRLRLIFEAAQHLDTTDDDFPALRAGVVAALGEARADEILAPEF